MGKKRKNMPGYVLGQNSAGRKTWMKQPEPAAESSRQPKKITHGKGGISQSAIQAIEGMKWHPLPGDDLYFLDDNTTSAELGLAIQRRLSFIHEAAGFVTEGTPEAKDIVSKEEGREFLQYLIEGDYDRLNISLEEKEKEFHVEMNTRLTKDLADQRHLEEWKNFRTKRYDTSQWKTTPEMGHEQFIEDLLFIGDYLDERGVPMDDKKVRKSMDELASSLFSGESPDHHHTKIRKLVGGILYHDNLEDH